MTAVHTEQFPGAGKTYALNAKGLAGDEIRVEDYWDRVYGTSWMDSDGNQAALNYTARSAVVGLPVDDEVVYGKTNGFSYLVHVSELGQAVSLARTPRGER